MDNVLLTGGAGFIGSHTALEFLNAGVDVTVVDDFSNSSPKALERVQKLTGKSVTVFHQDACDVVGMRKVFESQPIDAVVHFAGFKAVGESVEKPLDYYRNNIDSALTVCELMREFNVHKIVFSSSATVYGEAKRMPITEDFPTGGCTNPYGWTKFMIERILLDAAKADPNLSVTLLRYFNPVGAHESGEIGEDPQGRPNNLAPFITQVAVGKRDNLDIYGNTYPTPDGTGVRDYIHVVDLAKGHVAAYQHAQPGAKVYNLGTGKGTSVLEFVAAFERATGVHIPYKIVAPRSGDVAECYADASLAARELGWTAKLGLDEMCRDAYNWQSKNPNGYRD